MRRSALIICAIALAVCTSRLAAQPGSARDTTLHFKAEIFGDYYYKVRGDTLGTALQYANVPRDRQAFQLRRAQVSAILPMGLEFLGQLTLEHTDRVLTQQGQIGMHVKFAFVEWNDILPHAALAMGLLPVPTWAAGIAEKTWGYRGIEKTIADVRALGSSADAGISFRGTLDDGRLGYMAMFGNGSGIQPEFNKYKKYYAALNYRLFGNLWAEIYGDYEDRTPVNYKWTAKGVLAWQQNEITIGTEVIDQLDHCGCPPNGERNRLGISAYAHASLLQSPNLRAVLRYDTFDPDTKLSNYQRHEALVLAGLDYRPTTFLHIMPNVWISTFTNEDPNFPERPTDVVARLTVWFTYE